MLENIIAKLIADIYVFMYPKSARLIFLFDFRIYLHEKLEQINLLFETLQ